jgi:hypothetical protein
MARLRAVVVSHAAGLLGMPSIGQRTSAEAKASCVASSARVHSPVSRMSAPTILPQSVRETSVIV